MINGQQNLLKTLEKYKQVQSTINEIRKESKTIDRELEEQFKYVSEFIQLLPIRIAHIKV